MKKAIIVGATSGIGNELAKALSKNGYIVGVTGRRLEKLEELKNTSPDSLIISSFDSTLDNNSQKLEELANKLGGLDLLILSSGTGDINENLDFEIENRINKLNVIAFTEILTWTFNYFNKQKSGHLVAISSIAGIRGSRFAPAYNASKSYQINYLEGLRQKANKISKNIHITDIRPGFVDTNMAKGDGLFWVASKEKASKQIFNIIKKKKSIAYVSKRWLIIAIILRILPNWLYKKM